ncbi:MAG TPA: hypothetical protein VIC62_21100 [Nakamurella sp.]|jgi:hypothetical protein
MHQQTADLGRIESLLMVSNKVPARLRHLLKVTSWFSAQMAA